MRCGLMLSTQDIDLTPTADPSIATQLCYMRAPDTDNSENGFVVSVGN